MYAWTLPRGVAEDLPRQEGHVPNLREARPQGRPQETRPHPSMLIRAQCGTPSARPSFGERRSSLSGLVDCAVVRVCGVCGFAGLGGIAFRVV